MPDAGHGFQRAIITLIVGVVVSLVVRAMLESFELENLAIIVSVLIYGISIFLIIALSEKMKYWGFMYTIGWFFGLIIMLYALSSIISPVEIVLYAAITIIALAVKISNKI